MDPTKILAVVVVGAVAAGALIVAGVPTGVALIGGILAAIVTAALMTRRRT